MTEEKEGVATTDIGSREQALEASLRKRTEDLSVAAADVEYWYQVTQAFCLRLAQKFMSYDELAALIRDVEMDAATDFEEVVTKRRGLYRMVCQEMFEGLRQVREEKRKEERIERERG